MGLGVKIGSAKRSPSVKMATLFSSRRSACSLCGDTSKLVSSSIGVCVSCIREKGLEAFSLAEKTHEETRRAYGLLPKPPRADKGIRCPLCSNGCTLAEGEAGYCGLRVNTSRRLVSLSTLDKGVYYAYLDPHVTNCCSAWFCPAGTGAGYPKYAYRKGPELGYYNLAVFFYGCNFDCLFCQNHSHKRLHETPPQSMDDLVERTLRNNRITCWCFFGGSPEPQLPFAINASRRILETMPKGRILRICFEWNGCGNPHLVRRAAELSLKTGGNLKFDLKCWSEDLSYALSGVSNRRAYENFEMIAREYYYERSLPVLTATTLLVPGYVDEKEVEDIAKFIASFDREIPYSLLVFHPDYLMRDLPITPLNQASACYRAAKKHLKNVNIGNVELLGFRSKHEFDQLFK